MPADNAPHIEAVIFDLDGTLVHSSPDIAFHLNQAFQSCLGAEASFSDELIETLIGGGLKDIISKGFHELGMTPDEDLFDQVLSKYRLGYLDRPVINTKVYEGVEDMLKRLDDRGVKIGLCTNKTESAARKVLDHFHLSSWFGAVIGGDTTATRKPEPESLNAAMAGLGTAAEHTIMVGDSKADYGAAQNANCRIMLVDWGYSAIDIRSLNPNMLISSYDEFDQALGW